MGMYHSDDPYHDFDLWDADQDAWLNSLPVCKWCGEHIQDEYAYQIDGGLVCKSCLDAERVSVDDLMQLKE